MIIRGNISDTLAPGFIEIFNSSLAFGEKPPQMTELFNMKTSSRQFEEGSYVSGLGLLATKSEGADVSYDDIIQGLDKRTVHDTWALAYSVSKEAVEDELYGILRELPAALARSTRATIEIDGANVLNNGFDVTYAGGDSLELFSTLHPLLGGGTQKNELTNPADLDADSLEQAFLDLYATTDDRGILYNLLPKTLVVHPSNLWNAQRLLQSSLDPDSANNAINPAQGAVRVVVNNYLTDPDAWFLYTDNHKVNWFWRIQPSHDDGMDFDSDTAKFKVRARWSKVWFSPWGVFGTPGG